MAKVSDLKQKKVALIAEARNLTDSATEEARSFTAEEVSKFDALTNEIDSLDVTIRSAESIEKRTRELATAEVATERDGGNSEGAQEYRSAFEMYVRYGQNSLSLEQRQLLVTGADEARADTIMVKGTGNVGGYTVPTSFLPRIVEKLEENSPVYSLVQGSPNFIETSGGEDLQVPQVTAHASAVWVAENSGAFDSVSDTFAQVTLKAYTVAEIMKLSMQLLQDSGVDLEAYIANSVGGSIGRTVGTALSTGASNSTTTPQGVVTSATVGKTSASATAFTADELFDTIASVKPPYRTNAQWLFNDATLQYVRKLKDSQNRYLWETSMQLGQPDRLLGYAVYSDPNISTQATGNIVGLFGNVARGYMIRQSKGFNLRRLDERFADLFQVAFLGYMRIDGKLVDANAVKSLKMA